MQKYGALLIDGGTGNLHSGYNAPLTLGFSIKLSKDPQDLQSAGRIILPGVGAFGGFIEGLKQYALIPALQEAAVRGTPIFGICVGMQALFSYSTEMGKYPGLDLLPGKVLRFGDKPGFKIPHTGWNQLWFRKDSTSLFKGLPDGCHAYFNHAYYCLPRNRALTSARTDYLIDFTSAVQKDNIFGVQFHPEKSQRVGQTILANFFKV
ncbi:MAG: imidazole glycerol phosphate synthase subunit HisH [Anaerolineaceae bacterium]|nr:imidazole glycerol phosphate synthase subunit HisH [Anaerolineaceae bacterium]